MSDEHIVAEEQRAVVLALRRVLSDIEDGADHLGDAKKYVRYYLDQYENGARSVIDEIAAIRREARREAFADAISALMARREQEPSDD